MASSVVAEITIITIAKNNARGLQLTLSSLLSQTFNNWISVVVIGDSLDNTLEVGLSFMKKDSRITVVNQRDSGIYQAMNLGSRSITTNFAWYMNAGDLFKSPISLSLGLSAFESHMDLALVIGHHDVQNSKKRFKSRSGDLNYLTLAFSRRGLCHQAMIFNTKYLELESVYNPVFRYCADYDLVLRLIKNYNGIRVPQTLCSIEPGGVSDVNLREVHREKHLIRKRIFHQKYWINIYGIIWMRLLFIKIRARNIFTLLKKKSHG